MIKLHKQRRGARAGAAIGNFDFQDRLGRFCKIRPKPQGLKQPHRGKSHRVRAPVKVLLDLRMGRKLINNSHPKPGLRGGQGRGGAG